ASRTGPPTTNGFGASVSTRSRHSSQRTAREIDDAYFWNEPAPPPPDHGPPPDRSFARRGLRRVGRTRPVQALARAAPGHSPQGRDELWYWEADHAGRLWAHYCRYLRVERPRLLEFAWMSEATRGLESRVTVE